MVDISCYVHARTMINGNREVFFVRVFMHRGSGLSLLLFVIVMEAIGLVYLGNCYTQMIWW